VVRVTHWVTAVCFLALLWSGANIVTSHPRFYWGETGNVLTPALFELPIPASRSYVRTGYDYVLPDQNGWSRSLHFQAAWFLVFGGLVYAAYALVSGHLRKNLLPARSEMVWRSFSTVVSDHLRFKAPPGENGSYNLLQRLTYVFVAFVVFPLMVWTGLAMSPAVVSVFPPMVTVFGGHQSARTIHFVASVMLVLFLLVHVAMVYRAGFTSRTRAMITGRASNR
jgi:thiosulfate reductase cytochrome b subunit